MTDQTQNVAEAESNDLFIGMDRMQLGVVLTIAKTSQTMGEIVRSDEMLAAFDILRAEYKEKTLEQQLEYVRSLRQLAFSGANAAMFATNLCQQTEDLLIGALLAQRNVASVTDEAAEEPKA